MRFSFFPVSSDTEKPGSIVLSVVCERLRSLTYLFGVTGALPATLRPSGVLAVRVPLPVLSWGSPAWSPVLCPRAHFLDLCWPRSGLRDPMSFHGFKHRPPYAEIPLAPLPRAADIHLTGAPCLALCIGSPFSLSRKLRPYSVASCPRVTPLTGLLPPVLPSRAAPCCPAACFRGSLSFGSKSSCRSGRTARPHSPSCPRGSDGPLRKAGPGHLI